MTRGELVSYIDRTWPDDEAAELAKRILGGLATLRRQETACLSYEHLLSLIGLQDITPDFHSALMILTGSKHAVLRAYGIFLDEDGEEYSVSGADFSELILAGTLTHPHYGEPVKDALQKVAPVFEVIDPEAVSE